MTLKFILIFIYPPYRSKNLSEYISTLENNIKLKNTDIAHLESEIGMLKSEKTQVASEMSAVNQVSLSLPIYGADSELDRQLLMILTVNNVLCFILTAHRTSPFRFQC